MNKYFSIFQLTIIIILIAITTNYAHESDTDSKGKVDEVKRERDADDKKIMKYVEIIKSDPENAEAHFKLGIITTNAGGPMTR